MIYSFFKTNKLWITAMRWSLGHRHIHTLIPWQYNVINQPGGLWAGLSGTDDVLSNDHQIREDYIHTLVICLRNTDPLSACVCETEERERETVFVCQYECVTVSSVWETFVYMHVCIIMEGKQCQATHSEELQAYDPIKAMLYQPCTAILQLCICQRKTIWLNKSKI